MPILPGRETLGEEARRLAILSSRLRASRSLVEFTRATHPPYAAAAHHHAIAARLEAIERGEIDRLMIFMPPRHGKSELASRRFPAWYLGRRPDRQVIAASHNVRLAAGFGRQVRNLIASPWFADIFPGVGIAPDSRAADRMNTNFGGAYFAAGVGTAITGHGADLLLIDDPLRGRIAADSERARDTLFDWYRADAYTRLMPGGAIVLIQTRWHEDDLAGRLLESGADAWEVLELPAISDDGAALWPGRFGLERLERIRANTGPREWSALYQQRPQPPEGTFFRREWFPSWKQLPPKLALYGTSDYAVTDGRGDFTVHRIWGVDADRNLYRVDGWRGRATPDVWIERKLDLVAKHEPFTWFGEKGGIRNAIEPLLEVRMRERNVYCRMEWLASAADKQARARAFQGRASQGCVRFEPGADLSEFLAFPAGRHDDEVDCASLIGRALDQAHPAIATPPRRPTPKDRWDKLFDDRGSDTWRTI